MSTTPGVVTPATIAPPAGAATPTVTAKRSFFSKVWHDISVAEHAVISFMVKAKAEVPEATALVAQYGPEATALLNTISPGAGKFATTGANAAGTILQLIEDGGTAAEQNLTNIGFDQSLINDIKALGTNLKASVPKAVAAVKTTA